MIEVNPMQTQPATSSVPTMSPNTRAAAGKALAVFLVLMIVLTLANRALNELTVAQVEVISPQRGALERRIEGSGTLAASESLPVYAEAEVRVTQVYVRAGQRVAQGAPLFALDAEALAEKVKDALRELEKAQQAHADAEQAVAYAKADMSKSALETYEKAQRDVDKAQVAYDTSVADGASEAIIKRKQETLESAIRTRDKKSNVRTYFEKETALAKAQQTLADEQKKYDEQLRIAGNDGIITAPVDGEVVSLAVKVGEHAPTNKAALMLAPLAGQLELRVTVSEEDAGELAVGDEAEVTVNGQTSRERVASITASTDASGKYEVCLVLDASLGRAGMNGKMTVRKRTAQYDTLIPYSALRKDNTGNFVYVLTERDGALGMQTAATRYDVLVLDEDGTRCAVQGGVSPRDRLIVRSDRDIAAGDRVRIQGD